MGQRRLFEYDPHRGLRIDYEDLEGGGFALHYSQDVEDLLDLNKECQNSGADMRKSEFRHYASVPITVQYEWIRRYGVDPLAPEHQDLLARLLNDPEWRYLKTQDVII
jgi:hypothetical protein